MKEYLPQKSVVLKISRFSLVTILVFSWIFSGWPQIWPLDELGVNKIRVPSKIQKAQAAINFDRTPSEASILPPASMGVSVVFPDDLIYNGSPCSASPCPIGSVGLTREPLLNMKWWGIVVYTETDNFVSECVSTTSPLPTAVFNLGAGDYKTEISLAETKADCETFNQNSYPLFAVLGAANFNVK